MLQHSDMEGEMAQVQDMLSVIGENLGLSVFSTRCPRFLLEKYGSGCDGHLHERLREECSQQRRGAKHCVYIIEEHDSQQPLILPTTPPVCPSDQGGVGPTVWTKLARCCGGGIWLRHQLWGRVTLLPWKLLSAQLFKCQAGDVDPIYILYLRSQDFSTCSLLAASLFVCGDVLRIALMVLMK